MAFKKKIQLQNLFKKEANVNLKNHDNLPFLTNVRDVCSLGTGYNHNWNKHNCKIFAFTLLEGNRGKIYGYLLVDF